MPFAEFLISSKQDRAALKGDTAQLSELPYTGGCVRSQLCVSGRETANVGERRKVAKRRQ
jgi:hypothetical protein